MKFEKKPYLIDGRLNSEIGLERFGLDFHISRRANQKGFHAAVPNSQITSQVFG